MKVLETDRLILRKQTPEDAAFILTLLNEPSWLQFIGDRGVRTLEDARAYILNGAIASYEKHGFGFYLTERKEDGALLGMCGLVKRDFMEDVDIGFAFLPQYWGQGYAYESASAVMTFARETLNLTRIVAITAQDNHASAKLLEKLGLRFEGTIQFPNDPEVLRLFAFEETSRQKEKHL